MRERPRDLAWEALIRATKSNPAMERGKLNTALTAIKEAWHSEGGLPEDLPFEIERRAMAYKAAWPHLTLTGTALAKHWFRVIEASDQRTAQQKAIDELLGEG